ncbi:MAG: WG repeat-containing protein, partial [Bacteroidota bacterium]
VDLEGNMVVAPQYHKAGKYSEGLVAVWKGGFWSYLDLKGDTVISDLKYRYAGEFQDGYARLTYGSGSFGYVDRTGKRLRAPYLYFEKAGKYENGLAVVRENKEWRLIDQRANVRSALFKTRPEFHEGLAAVKNSKRYGLLSETGTPILEPEFDDIRYTRELISVRSGDRIGYLTTEGEWIWRPDPGPASVRK